MIDYVQKIYVKNQWNKSVSWTIVKDGFRLIITDSSNDSYQVDLCKEEAEVLIKELNNFVNNK